MTIAPDAILQVKEVTVPSAKDRKRTRFEYPLKHSTSVVDFGIWDIKFLMQFTKGLTIHQFETPPKRVLDLGCGSGYWSICYARQYPDTIVIGMDLYDVQPKINRLASTADIAGRVHWVKGDILEPLAFDDNYFDMVRASYLGLGVPESEWQYMLEEVYRVLKPSGVLELLDEDLIFPGGPPEETSPPPSAGYLGDLTFGADGSTMPSSLESQESNWSFDSPGSSHRRQDPRDDQHFIYNRTPTATTGPTATSTQFSQPSSRDYELNFMRTKSSSQESSYHSHNLVSPLDTSLRYSFSGIGMGPDDEGFIEGVADPLDHTKLKAAWSEMLSMRFLASKTTNVLPLYLSTIFEEYRALPAMEIQLPRVGATELEAEVDRDAWASSAATGARKSGRTSFGRTMSLSESRRSSGKRSEDRDCTPVPFSRFGQKIDPTPYRTLRRATVKDEPISSASTSANNSSSSLPQSSSFVWTWAPMHLERMVQMVKGCKEAIWEAYEKLYGKGPLITPVLDKDEMGSRTAMDRSKKNTARDEFETAWLNWENDMADRVDMRGIVESTLHWSTPPGEPPDWRVWRDRVRMEPIGPHDGMRNSFSGHGTHQSPPPDEVCRCVRGFVAWKDPSHQPAPILNGS